MALPPDRASYSMIPNLPNHTLATDTIGSKPQIHDLLLFQSRLPSSKPATPNQPQTCALPSVFDSTFLTMLPRHCQLANYAARAFRRSIGRRVRPFSTNQDKIPASGREREEGGKEGGKEVTSESYNIMPYPIPHDAIMALVVYSASGST